MSERQPPEKVPQVRPEYPIVRPDVQSWPETERVKGMRHRRVQIL